MRERYPKAGLSSVLALAVFAVVLYFVFRNILTNLPISH
jgi:hypothetical protein